MKKLKSFIKMKIEQFLWRTFDVEIKTLYETEARANLLEEECEGLINKVKRLEKDMFKLQKWAEEITKLEHYDIHPPVDRES